MTEHSPNLRFELQATDGQARAGLLHTARGPVPTPVFMPVGTQASVKSQTATEVEQTGARIVLANTYHLMLRPGSDRIQRLGGLHRFMQWPHAVLTDSGGYQAFSLSPLRKLSDQGVRFRSHLDGSLCDLSPERAMQIQAELGSDIAMVLDDCPPGDAERARVEEAVRRSTEWAERCLRVEGPAGQARFGIVQGGTFTDLRLAHLEALAALPFDGLALGGFSVGEEPVRMRAALEAVSPAMPARRPRYLMGVGKPADLLHAVGVGVDMFDCVLPTRNARNGQALTWAGRVNLRQARHREDPGSLDPRCECNACTGYSRAYLHHLVRAKEMLGPRLLTTHNLHFYASLMREARAAICRGRYAHFAEQTAHRIRLHDEIGAEVPTKPSRHP